MPFANIGKALASLRQQRGLSQDQLAQLCENGRSQVSRYESSRELMKLATLGKILARLAVAPDDFFRFLRSFDDPSAPRQRAAAAGTQERQLADAFQNLHTAIDELRQVVERTIDPAARFVKLIDKAAVGGRQAMGATGPNPAPR
jgi:transcriptional regulator with XRE-family HTH domain